MCQPRKWLYGLLPLLLLGILAGYWQQGDLEADLRTRSQSALAAGGFTWGKVAIAGRDAILSGEAPSPDAKALALKAIAAVEGVRRASDATTLLAEAKPFTLNAQRDGARVTLTGFVPDAASREALVAAVKKAAAGANVVDETRIARGAPAEFTALAGYGLSQLGRLSQGTLQLSDSVLSLTGRAGGFEEFGAVRSALASVPAGGKLAKGLGAGDILPPLVKPYTFEAVRSGSTVTLSGYVPSAEARMKLLADAKAAGLTVRDSLKVADGAPSGDWSATVGLGMAALARLESGRLSMNDDKLSLIGKAGEAVSPDAVKTALNALPKGFGLGTVSIEGGPAPKAPDPAPVAGAFAFEALRGDKTLMLKGMVPDEKARADLLALAGRLFEGDRVSADLTVAGVPKDAMAAVTGGLQLLSRLNPGSSLTIANADIRLRGLAHFDAARNAVAEDFKRMIPAGFSGAADIGTAAAAPSVGAAECQTLFNQVLMTGTVRFRVASAQLNDESRGILDKLTAVALRCGSVKIEIGGHTDADGSSQDNAMLSRRRAETVALYFTHAGIAAAQLEPVGYGETKPLAPNDSPENKARNRRIEFVVK